jgi:hypothetical protein
VSTETLGTFTYAFTGIYICPCCDIWSVPDLGQMRSVTWVLKKVDPVGLYYQGLLKKTRIVPGVVSDLPLCLGELKHRAPLAREGGIHLPA